MAINIVDLLSFLALVLFSGAIIALFLFAGKKKDNESDKPACSYRVSYRSSNKSYSSFYHQYQIWRFYVYSDGGCLQLSKSI